MQWTVYGDSVQLNGNIFTQWAPNIWVYDGVAEAQAVEEPPGDGQLEGLREDPEEAGVGVVGLAQGQKEVGVALGGLLPLEAQGSGGIEQQVHPEVNIESLGTDI